MAYLALARKWRPKGFSEVVGQAHVVQALSNALDAGRVHHAFLFTGTRGVGKTTLARIFAKSLNCENGVSAEPCQQCTTCTSIDEGRYVDLVEVDAASRTKVDDTRELLENIHYAPTYGKYKVFLIDEVHMLSGHSFNALLKTLEEPPEHVKFLFATTDPQKLPVTVLSRCLQFNLRAMRPEQVENQLVKILASECIEYDQSALFAIAKAADGSMRDGLSLLDQAIAQGGGAVRSVDVQNMLGTIKAEHTQEIVQALASQNVDQALAVVEEMAGHAVDFSVALDDVLVQLYYLSLAQVAPDALSAADANVGMITELAQSIDAETVQLYYQVGLISKRDLPLAPSLRVGFEMALLRMFAFEPAELSPRQDAAPSSQEATAAAEETSSSAVSAASGGGNTADNQLHTEQLAAADMPAAGSLRAALTGQTNAPPVDRSQGTALPTAVKPTTDTTHTTATQADQALADKPSRVAVTLAGNNEWGELVERTELVGMAKQLAMNCACERLAEDRISLVLAPKTQHLFKPERLAEIQTNVRLTLGSQVAVHIDVEESDKETPAECLARLGFEQFEQTKQELHNDPGVKALMSEFGATINENSIKPV